MANTGNLRHFQPGDDPRRGHGVKGKSGRKPEVFKAMCAQLVSSAKAKASIRAILADHKHPHFAAIYKHLSEQAFGKATQPVSGEGGGPLVVRVIREDGPRARN